jgi:hypothetical protein
MLNRRALNRRALDGGGSPLVYTAGDALLRLETAGTLRGATLATGEAALILDTGARATGVTLGMADATLELATTGTFHAATLAAGDAPLTLDTGAVFGFLPSANAPLVFDTAAVASIATGAAANAPLVFEASVRLTRERPLRGQTGILLFAAPVFPSSTDPDGATHVSAFGDAPLGFSTGAAFTRLAEFSECPLVFECQARARQVTFGRGDAPLGFLTGAAMTQQLHGAALAPLVFDGGAAASGRVSPAGDAPLALDVNAAFRGVTPADGGGAALVFDVTAAATRERALSGAPWVVEIDASGEAVGAGQIRGAVVFELFGSGKGYANSTHMDEDGSVFYRAPSEREFWRAATTREFYRA